MEARDTVCVTDAPHHFPEQQGHFTLPPAVHKSLVSPTMSPTFALPDSRLFANLMGKMPPLVVSFTVRRLGPPPTGTHLLVRKDPDGSWNPHIFPPRPGPKEGRQGSSLHPLFSEMVLLPSSLLPPRTVSLGPANTQFFSTTSPSRVLNFFGNDHTVGCIRSFLYPFN